MKKIFLAGGHLFLAALKIKISGPLLPIDNEPSLSTCIVIKLVNFMFTKLDIYVNNKCFACPWHTPCRPQHIRSEKLIIHPVKILLCLCMLMWLVLSSFAGPAPLCQQNPDIHPASISRIKGLLINLQSWSLTQNWRSSYFSQFLEYIL